MAADDLREALEAWIRHGEAVPADVTIYDREIVNTELRALLDAHPTPSEPEATVVKEHDSPACSDSFCFCDGPGPSDLATLLGRLLTDEYGDEGWSDLGSLRRIVAGIKAAGWRQVPEPATSNPGSKLEQVGAAGGGLSEDERLSLLAAGIPLRVTTINGAHETGAVAAVERIVREREAAAWTVGYKTGYSYRGPFGEGAGNPVPTSPYEAHYADREGQDQ